jgi:23S rRNA (guanosine2251-2'-O)-methyltransferase
MQREKIYIYGRHAVTEAVRNAPHAVKKIFFADESAEAELVQLAAANNIPTGPLKAAEEARAGHQGLIAAIDAEALLIPFDTFITSLSATPDTALVLMSGLTDPHNVGAIIRSAAAFGMQAVLMPEHGQALITGAVAKSSAGMIFRVPLVAMPNQVEAQKKLAERGFMLYGLAGESGAESLHETRFEKPSVFVVGNEGAGLDPETRKEVSLLSIPIHERTESLNAAAAAAVVMYAWSAQHPRTVH